MLNVNAVFSYKESTFRPKDCVVEKVIRLSGTEYDHFARNLLRDWDFIRDNPIDTVVDAEGRYHCLLVVGKDRRDGILVNSEGGAYARYSAFIPNAEDLLSAGQYPALAALNKKLADVVEEIAEQSGAVSSDGRVVVDLKCWDSLLGLDPMADNVLLNTVLGMLDERPEIADCELDNGELIIYRKPDEYLAAGNFSDPSVTLMDMYAYGYSYEGMIPINKERALELFDKGHMVFYLCQDDTEGAVNRYADIKEFDGLFGVLDPVKSREARSLSIEAFILNRERFEKGETVGEWLMLPADVDALRGLLERIGVDRPSESAFSVTAVRLPYDSLSDYATKYDSLDELNLLASYMKDTEDYDLNKLQAILTSDVKDIGSGISALINVLYSDNLDAFNVIDADNAEALGRYWARETDEKPDGVSFEQYGYQCVKEEGGVFTKWGYIYFRHKELSPEYSGVVPDEYSIVDKALRGLRSKTHEHSGPDEKPSVLDQISAARQTSRQPGNDAPKHKKDKGGPEL